MITDEIKNEIQKLENACNSRIQYVKRLKVVEVLFAILGVISILVGFWAQDNFFTPFWIWVGVGLLAGCGSLVITILFAGNSCDMLRLQIITFKAQYGIKEYPKKKNIDNNPQQTTDDSALYVGGIKLENYDE